MKQSHFAVTVNLLQTVELLCVPTVREWSCRVWFILWLSHVFKHMTQATYVHFRLQATNLVFVMSSMLLNQLSGCIGCTSACPVEVSDTAGPSYRANNSHSIYCAARLMLLVISLNYLKL